jgi:hypothetical protein
MRNRVIGIVVILMLVLAVGFTWVSIGKTQIVIQPVTPNPNAGQRRTPKLPAPGAPHDPHDLSGIWLQAGSFPGPGLTTEADPSVRTEWTVAPLPLTAAGFVAINAHKGGKGPRAVAPAVANDPIGDANPPGLIRTFVYGRPFQFIMLPNEVVNLFEWYHMWRQIHMDGRKLPDDPDALWYGTSIGHWDGDTFVAETNGMDTRSWLDQWGAPFSDVAKVTERWHRLDRDNMTLTITIDDPKFYTKAWTSDPHNFKLPPKGDLDSELEEVIFAPWDEQNFNKRIRDPNPIITTGYQGNPTQR